MRSCIAHVAAATCACVLACSLSIGSAHAAPDSAKAPDSSRELVAEVEADPINPLMPIVEDSVTLKSLVFTRDGATVTWAKASDVQSYHVLRRDDNGGMWAEVGTVPEKDKASFVDDDIDFGHTYTYLVRPLMISGEYGEDSGQATLEVPALQLPTFSTKRSDDKRTLAVKASSKDVVDGYEVQYAYNSLFKARRSAEFPASAAQDMTIGDTKAKEPLFTRVRTVCKIGSHKRTSAWTVSKNVRTYCKGETSSVKITVTKTKKVKVKIKPGKKEAERAKKSTGKKKTSAAGKDKAKSAKKAAKDKTYKIVKKRYKAIVNFDVVSRSKQTQGAYDTVQGSCSDGTFSYHALHEQGSSYAKIVKVRLSDMSIAQVSDALELHHANCMSYNKKTGKLIVTHNTGKARRVSIVDAETLKIDENIDLQVPQKLEGAQRSQLRRIKGFAAVDYCAGRDCYLACGSDSSGFIVYDAAFTPVRYMSAKGLFKQTVQGMTTTADYILVLESAKSPGQSNRYTVLDWSGAVIKRVKIATYLEPEDLFFAGSKLYMSVYGSGYGTITKKVKVKKKTVKRKYRAMVRSAYVYRIPKY